MGHLNIYKHTGIHKERGYLEGAKWIPRQTYFRLVPHVFYYILAISVLLGGREKYSVGDQEIST